MPVVYELTSSISNISQEYQFAILNSSKSCGAKEDGEAKAKRKEPYKFLNNLLGTHFNISCRFLIASLCCLVKETSTSIINKTALNCSKTYFNSFQANAAKQPLRGILRKIWSENTQQIYRRTPMPKYDFNKFAKEIGCFSCKLFRTALLKTTSDWLLLNILFIYTLKTQH